ncbi:MAG: ATP-binding protein, partial [Rhodothermales bacterium]|nr:ATP-binding protein [Rhodothermales bacterium]
QDPAEARTILGDLKVSAQKIEEHGRRADGIIKNMLLHSHGGPGEYHKTDLNHLLDEYLNLAYHGIRAQLIDFNVDLVRDFDPAVGEVEVVPQQLGRVFINLFNNAFYAMNEKAREEGASFHPELRVTTRAEGARIRIRVVDNGPGIPPEIQRKVFEPFFTTKPTGDGTGLGLSLSHEVIAVEHGGTLEVESEEGTFTAFTILLPRRRRASSVHGDGSATANVDAPSPPFDVEP